MIEVQGLQKFYGNFQALKGLDFIINQGEILGLLGPNGAGKTTIMRILTGFLKPSRGNIQVADLNVIEHSLKIKEMIGYLPESAPLYGEMLVYDYLAYVAEMRGLSGSDKTRRIAEMVDLCGLKEVISKAVHELSKGYKQRVGLAHAMMGDPEILVLDEPTSGLDPNQIVEIRQLIKKIGREKTVIFSTHILSEAEATCDRLVIINQGAIVADGPTDELLREFGAGVVVDIILTHPDTAYVVEKLSAVAGVERVEPIAEIETEISTTDTIQLAVFSCTDKDLRHDLYCLIREENWDLVDFHLRSESFENIFAQLTQEEC